MNSPARLPETYRDCLGFLYARNQFAMKLGLENINALLDRLARPDRGLHVLHVAGTNGKGSVCANLAALLSAAGRRRVGLYTSPHLVSFRERIRVDGAPVEREWILAWMRRAVPVILELNATYFEAVTAMALDYFKDRRCEAVVLETGLGGRLDATNAVPSALSVITSISLDHTHILGNTVEEIWREKIAILKPGVPMVVCERRPHLLAELEEKARAAGSPVFSLRDFPWSREAAGAVRFQGRFARYGLPADLRREDHQVENLCLSLLAMETLTGKAVSLTSPRPEAGPGTETGRSGEAATLSALRAARVPGRTQLLEEPGRVPVLLDGAHNPGGMQALAAHVAREFPRRRILALFGVMRDKAWLEVFRLVRSFAAEVRFVPLEASFPRALPWVDLSAALGPGEAAAISPFNLDPAAWADLTRVGPGQPDLVVVCGSLYLLGKAIPLLAPHYHALDPFAEFADEV